MELLQLIYFKEVADCGKISEAAKKLYISAPGLSATIKRLETELGTPLFTRTGNTIELNRQGEVFLHYVNQSINALEAGKTELKRFSETERHHVSIAATTSNLWVGLLSAFSLEYPQITISNTSLKLNQLKDPSIYRRYNFLLAEKNDFSRAGILKKEASGNSVSESEYAGLGLECRDLIKEDLPVLVVPKDHPAADQKTVSLQTFRNENFLLPVADMSLHRMATELLHGAGVPDKNLSECSYMLRRQMILEHRGIAFSTEYTSRSEDQTMSYVPILEPHLPQNHRIFWEEGRSLSEDEQTFLDFASAYFAAGIL